MNWLGAIGPPILIAGGLVLAFLLLLFVPKRQVRNLRSEGAEDEHKKFELENEARKTMAQILGGIGVVASLVFAAKQLTVAQQGQLTAQEAQIT